MDNTQLPAEVEDRIKADAHKYLDNFGRNLLSRSAQVDIYNAHVECATEYANKLHEAQQEIEEWKAECERLAKVAERWQQEYYKLKPPQQPMKIDNNPIA